MDGNVVGAGDGGLVQRSARLRASARTAGPVTAAAAIAAALRDDIVGMVLLPRTPLRDLVICERFGTSRTPVREALIRLGEEGLVEIVPQSGTFVSRIPLDAIPEAVLVRQALEGVTVEGAAARGGSAAAARLDALVPERVQIPTGERRRLAYADGDAPVLALRVQEAFGWTDTPTVLDGRVPVVLHLLSPAGRPAAVTSDLASFWRQGYPQVRADLRGRYPRHPWPDDPLTATPTRRASPRR